jgi:GNAT superfamily N-acetyltransferase
VIVIRDGQRADAAELARLISDFNVEEGSPGRLDEAGALEICFDEAAPFHAIVAEDDGDIVGYTLLMRYFDTEPCAWCTYMQDLYVIQGRRSDGIGRRLIAAAAKLTADLGRHALFWHVRDHNHRGRAFYASIGGKEETPIPVTLSGDALSAMAKEAR